MDFTIAPVIVRLLDQQLLPYGVDAPRDFLRAVGPEIATARLDREGERMALVALVRDEAAVRAMVRKRFGERANAVKIGDAEMFAAADEESGAAAFAAGHFITGDAESVRRCLQARASGRTLDGTEAFRRLAPSLSTTAHFLTLSDDREQARGFAALVARQRWAVVRKPADTAAIESSLSKLPFAASETRLTADGFERTTRSSFGQIGSLALRFSSDADSRR